MKKDAYWFSHDYEPVGDPKMQAMLNDYGGLGYGIFWRIAEMLHSEPEHKLPFKKYIFLAIAKQMQANGKQNVAKSFQVIISSEDVREFISDCVNDYELFISDDIFFWSNRVIRNIEKKDKVSKIRALVGGIGGKSKAIGKQTEAIAKQNVVIKGKERKEEEENINNSEGVPPPPPPDFNLPLSRFYRADDFNGLPQPKIEDFIRLVDVTKHVKIKKEDVETLWEVFKNQNLTGEKPYDSESAVYRHFLHTHKNYSFKKEPKPREKKSKNEKIVGVEFINDFSQCRMSDDSVVDLSTNQKDGARYNQINPSSIIKK